MEKLFAYNWPYDYLTDLDGFPSNTAIISINEEFAPLPKIKLDRLSSKILTLQFTDITAPLEHKGNTYNPLNKEQTLQILNFINIHKEKNFIVHCRAGVSRSSAVCLFIHLKYGHELRSNFWDLSEPNPFVLGRLFVESKRKYEI